jgi:hypothetical protein
VTPIVEGEVGNKDLVAFLPSDRGGASIRQPARLAIHVSVIAARRILSEETDKNFPSLETIPINFLLRR